MNHRVHGILQARILEWVAFPVSRGSSRPRNRIQGSNPGHPPLQGLYSGFWASQGILVVENLPVNVGDVRDMGSILEEGAATNFSILAWKVPWTEEPAGLQSIGSHKARHNTHTFRFLCSMWALLQCKAIRQCKDCITGLYHPPWGMQR